MVVARVQELTQASRQALQALEFEKAEQLAEEALALDPGAWRARAVLGNALLGRGMAVEPPDLYLLNRGDGETLTAVSRAPGDPTVGLLRVEFLTRGGHLSAAATAGEQALLRTNPSDDSDYVDLLAATAEACYELGEERRALPFLQDLAARRPDSAEAHFRLGYSGLQTAITAGQGEDAVRAFVRSAELAPDDQEAHLAVLSAYSRCMELAAEANLQAEVDKYQELALQACDDLAQRFPQLAEVWFRRGVILERSDLEQAEAAYLQALALQEEHVGALLNLAHLLHKEDGTLEAARKLWRRALAADGLTAEEQRRIQALLDQ